MSAIITFVNNKCWFPCLIEPNELKTECQIDKRIMIVSWRESIWFSIVQLERVYLNEECISLVEKENKTSLIGKMKKK